MMGALLALPSPAGATAPPTEPSTPPVTDPSTEPVPDPLGCADLVYDRSGVASDRLATTAAAIADELHADLHVRIEGNLDGDIDGREQLLETECPGWTVEGLRAPDLLIVMVSPSERSTSIYYGENFYETLSLIHI